MHERGIIMRIIYFLRDSHSPEEEDELMRKRIVSFFARRNRDEMLQEKDPDLYELMKKHKI